ncbi:lanthionine synthetase C family protein [Actinokineospora cianjurensis]|uniref:Lanthionine synthetase-like protein n=1 Tax=Actinokineospora cianjurensis TaxID=585224 RepID=A0A421AX81_9PSEU|nr:lanthionine synthetase C family protein [Actinokineospora cianjurensis]RLK54457.1 lanthionine synthetase-like protein [Actinokineospora cianjurensis]
MTQPRTVEDIVDQLARDLADPATVSTERNQHRPVPQSLANGAAGIALLHAERARTGHGDPATAHAWLAAATADGVDAGPQASLFYGAPALAFAVHAIADGTDTYQRARTTLHHATAALTRARLDQAHARIDRGEPPALAEFDLLRGLTGIGAYHLRVDPHSETAADVVAYLVRLTEPLPGGNGLPGWWSDLAPTGRPSPNFPHGHGNFGLAHGIAGPLALLALAKLRGLTVAGHTDAIDRILTWLDTWTQHSETGPWWPRTITPDDIDRGSPGDTLPGQPSWCYGTPGLARAQQLAAIATGDTRRQADAENALLACLSDPAQLDRITGIGLCHGAVGLLHITARAASDATSTVLASHLPDLTERLLAALERDEAGSELLDGRTGAALALHAAITGTTPATRWDTCLLLA